MTDWMIWLSWLRSLNWSGWLSWLNQYSGSLIAIVTTIYAIVTVLLWRATKQQATLTQRTVDATNRPYLSMRSQEVETSGSDAVCFTVLIENVGSVPAEITLWEVSASLTNLDGKQDRVEQFEGAKLAETLLGACLFPRQERPVSVEFRLPGIWRTPLPLHMTVTIKYSGPSESVYRTRVEVQRTSSEVRQRTTAT